LFKGTIADETFSSRGIVSALAEEGIEADDVLHAAEAARNGDRDRLRVFAVFGCELGTFLEPFVISFRADAVMVLGGIAGAIDLFGEALEQHLTVPVITSDLGVAAALLGAADCIFQQRKQNG
jgi:glucokinase